VVRSWLLWCRAAAGIERFPMGRNNVGSSTRDYTRNDIQAYRPHVRSFLYIGCDDIVL
jgi:hypothetical protein